MNSTLASFSAVEWVFVVYAFAFTAGGALYFSGSAVAPFATVFSHSSYASTPTAYPSRVHSRLAAFLPHEHHSRIHLSHLESSEASSTAAASGWSRMPAVLIWFLRTSRAATGRRLGRVPVQV